VPPHSPGESSCNVLGSASSPDARRRRLRAGTTFDLVKVLALRLVKLESPRRTDPDAVNLSAEGSWSGTPGYMAPEVVLGATDTDHRVDLYALGCVA
jgi:serine/threonine protein kinase